MSSYKDHIYALILAGGGGTRLWPRSRNKTPKQFLKLFNDQTLIEITARRLNKFIEWEKIFVVTVSEEYKKEVQKYVPLIPSNNIIVEPARKNTAPAHGIGAAYIYKKDRDAVIVNAASDHFVNPLSLYKSSMLLASKIAYEYKNMVAVGIKPTYPNIGYGYMKRGSLWSSVDKKNVYKLGSFKEKPELSIAKKYLKSGEYYWNANMYVWRADSYLESLNTYEPKVASGIMNILEAIGTLNEEKVVNEEYSSLPDKTVDGKDLSVDFAISEKSDNFLLLPATFSWTDIGDWKEVWENLTKDEMGNVVINGSEDAGEVINIDTSDALIHKNGRLIAVIDVDNIIIVDTKDALLIASKSKAQNVKQIVNSLKEKGLNHLL